MAKRISTVILVLLVLLLAATPVLAAENTITATTKIAFGFLGKTFMGTVVIKNTGTAEALTADWSFTGTVDGQAASLSGAATGKYTAAGYEYTITKVDQWGVPGMAQFAVPQPVSLVSGTGQTIWLVVTEASIGTISIPLALEGADKLPEPFAGNVAVSLTNVAGAEEIKGLPRTGAAPAWYGLLPVALLAAGGLFLLQRALSRAARAPHSL